MSLKRSERLRILIIDRCLKNGKFRWNSQALLFQVNSALTEDWGKPVTLAQLEADLDFMAVEYGSPIEIVSDGNTRWYEYRDPSFSIQNSFLSVDDITRVEEACSILKEVRSFNFAEDISYVINLLNHKIKLTLTEQAILHFEDISAPLNPERIYEIKEAILSKRVLKITYRKLGSAESEVFIVHPYFLKEYQSRWYLFGYSETSKAPRLYSIDRIHELEELGQVYIDNKFIGSEVYFKSLIGVMVNGRSKPEDIALWVSPKLAPFIISKPLHSSQFRENYDHTGLFIQLHVVVNPELISILLAYGPDLKVLYPAHLADQIKETAWKIAEQYSKE